MDIKQDLARVFRGELDSSEPTRVLYSHDASLFELQPQLVARPLDAKDVQALVTFVAEHKKQHPDLSITPRAAGTDMSGAAIGESIVMDSMAKMNKIVSLKRGSAEVQPGVFFRDFDAKCEKIGALLPSYPASRDLCAMGGIINNNSGGEKSLLYGKTDRYVTEMQMVLADGKQYTIKPLKKDALVKKMAQKDFEGSLYRKTFELLETNYDAIQAARPQVSKDSTGYHLWDVWNRETGVFDLTKLFVGAQGTLGIMTSAKLKLVERPEHSGLLVLFLRDINGLGELINAVLKHKPTSFEAFDDATLMLSIKFLPYFLKIMGPKKFIYLLFSLIPDGLQLLRGIPKMVLMVEFNGSSEDEVRVKIRTLHQELAKSKGRYEINGIEETPTEASAEKFWSMRRHSFNILRSKVKDKHTAPFIDDFIVPPPELPVFLPKLRKIIKKYRLLATIAGHMGDGNFHVIPLMKIEEPHERAKLQPAMKEVNELVLKHGGSISGEHNDGMVRGPWLERMYGKKVFGVLDDIKRLYDPQNIFNPRKKTDADWNFSFSRIRKSF